MTVFREKVIFIGNTLPGPKVELVKFISSLPDDLQSIIKINSEKILRLVKTKNLSKSSSILLPPEHILCENKISLKPEFYADSLRVDGEINGDNWHANERYGSVMIREILKFALPA